MFIRAIFKARKTLTKAPTGIRSEFASSETIKEAWKAEINFGRRFGVVSLPPIKKSPPQLSSDNEN